MYGSMDSHFIQWVIIHYYYYFDAQTVPDLASGSSFKLADSVPVTLWAQDGLGFLSLPQLWTQLFLLRGPAG